MWRGGRQGYMKDEDVCGVVAGKGYTKDEDMCGVVAGKGYLKDEGRCVAWWQARGI